MGIKHLSVFLQSRCNSIECLDLSECKIGQRGAITLIKGLHRQSTLKTLKLTRNPLGIDSNKSGRRPEKRESLHSIIEESFPYTLKYVNLESC